jgi:hypothetical protein
MLHASSRLVTDQATVAYAAGLCLLSFVRSLFLGWRLLFQFQQFHGIITTLHTILVAIAPPLPSSDCQTTAIQLYMHPTRRRFSFFFHRRARKIIIMAVELTLHIACQGYFTSPAIAFSL